MPGPFPAAPPSGGNDSPRPGPRNAADVKYTNSGVWEWDLRKGTVHCTPLCQAVLRQSFNISVPPDPFWHGLPMHCRLEVEKALAPLLRGESEHVTIIIPLDEEGGGTAWLRIRAVCLPDETGRPRLIAGTVADISEQTGHERVLKSAAANFRSLVEHSPDTTLQFAPDGRVIYISPHISGYSRIAPATAPGQYLRDLPASPEYKNFLQENMSRVLELKYPVQAELNFTSSLGMDIVIDARFWPEFDARGEILSIIIQSRDISLQQRMERSYHALFSSMVDGFALFERVPALTDGRADMALLIMNPAFASMHRLSPDADTGRRLSELMGRNAPGWQSVCSCVLANETARASLHDEEEDRYFEITAYSPEPERVACIVTDVTGVIAVEQEARLNEARFAALNSLTQMDDDTPDEAIIRFALDEAVRLTGSEVGCLYLAHAEGDGDARFFWTHRDAHHEGAEFLSRYALSVCQKAAQSGSDSDAFGIFEEDPFTAPAPGFAPLTRRFMLAPVAQEGKVLCVAGVANKHKEYNNSDLRQLELFIHGMWLVLRRRWTLHAARKAKEDAEAASRAKSAFLANVSHELRTPLNGVLGMLQLLRLSPLMPDQREFVETANSSGQSLLRILSDILDFSRLEADKMELRRQSFSIEQTLRGVMDMFRHEARQKKLAFSLHMDPGVPLQLLGDDARIRQIMFNLVGNAIKFTEQGQVDVFCSLLPHVKNGSAHIYLAVADTGIGIPDDQLGVIFDAFTQLDSSSTRAYPGTGLGLGIVHRLLTLMGGSLCMESEFGHGSTAHCSIPLPLPKAERPARPAARPAPELASEKILRILVVEDDAISRFTIKGLLERLGHEVHCVGNGRLALEALAARSFDCVLSDIQMPVMDGMEFARLLRLSGPEPESGLPALSGKARTTPLIALTAHAMAGDQERFLEAGFDYYLSKPIAMVDLTAALRWVITTLHSKGSL